MARPNLIRDEDILEAARAVFLERGVRATTAEVAERAGVSEGTLFKRFGSKALLFKAAMRVETNVEALEEGLAALRDAEGLELIEGVVRAIVRILQKVVPIILLTTGGNAAASEIPDELKGPNPMPLRAVRVTAAFFEGAIRAGKLRPVDAEILARSVIGAVWHFVFLGEALGAVAFPMPEGTFVRGLVDLVWGGVAPDGAGVGAGPGPGAKTKAKKAR
jgi:AcrR family transcriptional regulator